MSDIPLWAWLILIAAVLIVAVLAFVAGRLLSRLQAQNKRRDQAIEKRNERLYESIVTIAKSMDQGQCPLSEGALRLVVLLDLRVDPGKPDYAERYEGLHTMYERIKHMPTHEARKKYPKAEIRKYDDEREGYEKELEDVILADVRQLLKDFS
ncbi:DUF2489 domain-containing protein [Pseudidiomarina sp. 1APP75-27a]|uniref:DUF2489 domain-containing protein n=1 Tax=Pseudidiomarina terrestris TaxID=2820060 RepID=UPI002B059EE3|nr:DUF2489 domain-containing protein [Pseudidiomarina sp. 1APP75-27a]MEA3588573.1 DUF2489 domain-containing protein [Pseudidiomarina sp. 1APP75-27a]